MEVDDAVAEVEEVAWEEYLHYEVDLPGFLPLPDRTYIFMMGAPPSFRGDSSKKSELLIFEIRPG